MFIISPSEAGLPSTLNMGNELWSSCWLSSIRQEMARQGWACSPSMGWYMLIPHILIKCLWGLGGITMIYHIFSAHSGRLSAEDQPPSPFAKPSRAHLSCAGALLRPWKALQILMGATPRGRDWKIAHGVAVCSLSVEIMWSHLKK